VKIQNIFRKCRTTGSGYKHSLGFTKVNVMYDTIRGTV